MQSTKAVEYYKTTDLDLAAALLCIGHPLEDVNRKNRFGSRPEAVFCFQDCDQLQDDVRAYTNDTVEVSPRKLFSRWRELKTRARNALMR